MKNIIITLIAMCFAFNVMGQTILLNENFSGGLPASWDTGSVGSTSLGFRFNSIQVPSGPGFTYPFAKTSGSSSLFYHDCWITTRIIDASALSTVYLGYSEQFIGSPNYIFGEYLIQEIDVSNDSGLTWKNVLSNTLIHGYPSVRNVIDITDEAAGYSYVKVRFHYMEHDASGNWAIDSVVVADSIPCSSPPDSGKAASNLTFACPGTPVNLYINPLSRGIGQTYQWQYKNALSGNVYSDFAGATADTFSTIQTQTTYYRCNITCNSATSNGGFLYLVDTPALSPAYSTDYIRICTGREDTLRMKLPYGGQGVTYNWRWSATHNGSYTDIPGATNDYYVVSAANYSNNTSFWCRQICAANGAWQNYNWQIPVDEPLNPHPYCYCYPFSGNACNILLYYFANIAILGTPLNNSAGCIDTFQITGTNNHAYFAPSLGNTTATLMKNIPYTFSIEGAVRQSSVAIWIDYNHNNNFDANEYTFAGILDPDTAYNVSVIIPANAQPGLTGMRIRGWLYDILDSTDACLDLNGTTHDYLITIDSTVSVLYIEDGKLNIAVHPNPSKGETAITSHLPIKSLKLVTVTGGVVKVPLTPKGEPYSITVDVSTLPKGIYFVQVETEKGIAVKKLVVM